MHTPDGVRLGLGSKDRKPQGPGSARKSYSKERVQPSPERGLGLPLEIKWGKWSWGRVAGPGL